jgi:hypothetical protein
MQQLMNNAAGTNEKRYIDFENDVKAYHQVFRSYFEPLVYQQKKFTAENASMVPNFEYKGDGNITANGKVADMLFLIVLIISIILFSLLHKKADRI